MFIEPRKKLIEWVRKQLVGPPEPATDGPDLRGVLPTERFPCGALYPTSPWGEGIDPASEDIDEAEGTTEVVGESASEPAIVRRYIPPSSLGLSFFIEGDDIRFQVLCRAVRYERTERDEQGRFRNDWKRRKLVSGQGNDEDFENIACPGEDQCQSFDKLEKNARVDVLWRRFAKGWIVTVSLSNVQEVSDDQTGRDFVFERAQKTLFEAGLRCVIDAGDVGVYPRVDRSLLDPEEQEVELQYSHRHIYAIGHGCAADWEVKDGKVVELRSPCCCHSGMARNGFNRASSRIGPK